MVPNNLQIEAMREALREANDDLLLMSREQSSYDRARKLRSALGHIEDAVDVADCDLVDRAERRLTVTTDDRRTDAPPVMLAALKAAELVLAEQHDNCGGDDTMYAAPLSQVRAAISGAEQEWVGR